MRAEHPNHVWALDFQFDETADLRRLRLLNIVDEHTRAALAMDVGRSMDADAVVSCIQRLAQQRGAPQHLRMDNGTRADRMGVAGLVPPVGYRHHLHRTRITLGNPWIESFNGRARDELLNIQELGSLTKASVVIEDWRTEYNIWRPHSPSMGLTPAEYAAQWSHQHQPALPQRLDQLPGPRQGRSRFAWSNARVHADLGRLEGAEVAAQRWAHPTGRRHSVDSPLLLG